jgi:dienelactone hydrolase
MKVRQEYVIALLAMFALQAVAQERFVGVRPDPKSFTAERDIAYGSAPDLKYDLYRPSGNAVVPILIVANITGADYRTWPGYIGWGESGAAAGFAVVLYKASSAGSPADFDAVMASISERADALHVDPHRVVIWCGSSNVRLGLPLAMDFTRGYIRGVVVYYGSADVPTIRTGLPVLLVRSGLDATGLNEQINALVARALAANAPWIIENDAAGYHGFDVLNDNEVSRAIIGRTIDFIRSVTRPEIASAYAAQATDASTGAAFARGLWGIAAVGYRHKIETSPNDAEAHRRLGVALMEMKQYPESLQQFEEAWKLGRRGPRDTAYPAARAAAAAGNVPKAIEWLRIVFATRFAPDPAELQKDEAFAPVRNDPAFVEFTRSITPK